MKATAYLPVSASSGRRASLGLGNKTLCFCFQLNSPMCRAGKSSIAGMITSSLLIAVEEANLRREGMVTMTSRKWETWLISSSSSLAGSNPSPLDRAWLRARLSFPLIFCHNLNPRNSVRARSSVSLKGLWRWLACWSPREPVQDTGPAGDQHTHKQLTTTWSNSQRQWNTG